MNDAIPTDLLSNKFKEKRFNMNVQCLVKLTEYGMNIIRTDAPECRHDMNQDVLRTNLWTIMNIFGKYLYMGNNNIPFEFNEIVILENQI